MASRPPESITKGEANTAHADMKTGGAATVEFTPDLPPSVSLVGDGSRLRRVAAVLGAEVVAPIFAVLCLFAVYLHVTAPGGAVVGTVRVLPSPASFTDVFVNPHDIDPTFPEWVDGIFGSDIALVGLSNDRVEPAKDNSGPKPDDLLDFGIDAKSQSGVGRPSSRSSELMRLGDVAAGNTFDGIGLFIAAIYDPGLRIEPVEGAFLNLPGDGIGWDLFVSTALAQANDPKAAPVQKEAPAPSPTPIQSQTGAIPNANPNPAQTAPPTTDSGQTVGVEVETDTAQAVLAVTTPGGDPSDVRVLESAVTVALLKGRHAGYADAALLQGPIDVEPSPRWEMPTDRWLGGARAAVARVGGHLSPLAIVYLSPTDSETAVPTWDLSPLAEPIYLSFLRTLWASVATPLPVAGETDFLAVVTRSASIATEQRTSPSPSEAAAWFNPAFNAVFPLTRFPAMLFLFVLCAVLVRGWRDVPTEILGPSPRGVGLGLVLGAVFLGALFGARLLGVDPPMDWGGEGGTIPFLVGFVSFSTGAGLLGYGSARLALLGSGRKKPVPTNGDGTGDDEGQKAREQAPRDNMLRSILYADTPLDELPKEDPLGFRPLVVALHRFLDNKDTRPPVVIAVNGPWGSGKSSIMMMVASRLRRTNRFHIAWFNAWQYHREEQILAAFLKTVSQQLADDWGLWFGVRLGWIRFKRATFKQHLMLASVPVLAAIAIFYPDVLRPLGTIIAKIGPGAEAAATGLLGAGGIGGLLWVGRLLWPFHLQYKKLGAVNDPSARIGFIDAFRTEFELYRDAMGKDRKFLIIIDDLDRCLDRNIVEVLKTINLIVGGGGAASRTFFMLGYDPNFVIPSVELHFKDLVERSTGEGRFGEDFMKKMVTLSVGVPYAGDGAAGAMAERLDPPTEGPAVSSIPKKLAARVGDFRDWGFKPPLAALLVVMAVLSASVFDLRWPSESGETNDPWRFTKLSQQQDDAVDAPDTGSVVTVPAPETVAPDGTGDVLFLIGGLVLAMLGIGAIVRFAAVDEPEVEFRRETEDSTAFKNAIEDCGLLMPRNPRDIVRLMNLMRMNYLVQAEATGSAVQLDEWECVTFTLLQRRHGRVFFPTVLKKYVLPAAANRSADIDAAKFFTDLGAGEIGAEVQPLVGIDDFDAMATDIEVIKKSGRGIDHLADADKLRHFADFNYFALSTSEALYGVRQAAAVVKGEGEEDAPEETQADDDEGDRDDSPAPQTIVDRDRPPAAE